MTPARRSLLQGAASLGALSLAPWSTATAQTAPTAARTFSPQPGNWRTFEVTTRVDIPKANGVTRVWLPVPSVNSSWQKSEASSFTSNGITRMRSDGLQGVQFLYAEFAANIEKPYVEITSRVQTQSRAPIAKGQAAAPAEDAATLQYFTRATHLLPTDGIVKTTAQKAIQGASTDLEKVRAIYDWVVANAWRELFRDRC